MDISIICIPYANDIARWGMARGPAAVLDAGLIPALEAEGHRVDDPVWIEMPQAERTRDIVTNLGRIASRTSSAVEAALVAGKHVIVLEADCTHAVSAAGGLARAALAATRTSSRCRYGNRGITPGAGHRACRVRTRWRSGTPGRPTGH